MTDLTLATPQPIFVITEQIYNKPGLPAVGNTIGPQLRQVVRRVAQVHAVQDIYFEGTRVDGMPSTWQYLQEFVLPGNQITTQPTGAKSLVLVYAGYTNLITPLPTMQERTLPSWTGGIFRYGTDPVPQIALQGNAAVNFTSAGGDGAPTAVAIYNQTTGQIEVPSPEMRAQAISTLTQARP